MDGEERPPELTPAETARARRRDRHAQAKEREGMRTGLAKQFKQVLDAQTRRAGEPGPSAGAGGSKTGERPPRR